MQYNIEAVGFEGRELFLEAAGMFAGPKFMIDGSLAPKGNKRGEFLLTRNDGQEVVAKFGFNFLDTVPPILIDNKKINLIEPLKWYQWVWAGWPILLLFAGGAIGAILGIIATSINVRLFRSQIASVGQYLAVAGVSGVAAALYFVVVVAIQSL